MNLSGQQVKQVFDAIADTFDRNDLRLLTRFHLDKDLDAITKDDKLETVIFNLIHWCEKNGQLGNLIHGAASERPNSIALKNLAADFDKWQQVASNDATMGGNSQATYSGTRGIATPNKVRPDDSELQESSAKRSGLTWLWAALVLFGVAVVVIVAVLVARNNGMQGLALMTATTPAATQAIAAVPTPTPLAVIANTPNPIATETPIATPLVDAETEVAVVETPTTAEAEVLAATSANGCTDGWIIANPSTGQAIPRGYVTVTGQANLAASDGYTLGYAVDTPSAAHEFNRFVVSSLPKTTGSLGVWDTQALPAGDYLLQLRSRSDLSATAANDCTVAVTIADPPVPAAEPLYQLDETLPIGPKPIEPTGQAVVSSSTDAITFQWQDSAVPSDLLYDIRVFRVGSDGQQVDVIVEWNLPIPILGVSKALLTNPPPDVHNRLNALGLDNPSGEYRWQVRLAEFPSPNVHQFSKWGEEGVFVVAP